MLGAITGDIFAAAYEFDPDKHENVDLFERHRFFTDDTVLTIATADALMTDGDYTKAYRKWGRRYPDCSWGARFHDWLFGDDPRPYNSFGNGSAMRVSPIGWAFDTLEETLAEARRSAAVTHNHPEGIKGAQATAAAIFLARTGSTKEEIRREITDRFGYDLTRTIANIRPDYSFDVTCQGSVPEALIAFLDADDYEHTLQLVISLGGDADTQAAIAGAVAEAYFYRIPLDMKRDVQERLPQDMIRILEHFRTEMEDRFPVVRPNTDPHLDPTPIPGRPKTPIPLCRTPQDVLAWVDENTTHLEPERTVAIRNIEFDWDTLRGECDVEFDGVACTHRLRLGYGITAGIGYQFPKFHSPLGAPASYGACTLSPEASEALARAIDSVFPKIRAYGRQKDTGQIINAVDSTNRDRWPPKEILDKVKERLADPDFEITVEIDKAP